MREQAERELQPYHPWGDGRLPVRQGVEHWTEDVMGYLGGSMGEFCASWSPTVALAVANWLDRVAEDAEFGIYDQRDDAMPIARAYLGSDA